METTRLFEVITEYGELQRHMYHLQTAKVLGIDTETTGLDPLKDQIRLVQVEVQGYPVIIFDIWRLDQGTGDFLKELMANHTVKVFQNAKFDIAFLRQIDVRVEGKIFDTFIAAQLLRQRNRLTKFGLDTLAQHYLSIEVPKDKQTSHWNGDISSEQYEYAARDAAILIPLRDAMIRDLQAENMVDIARLEFRCVFAVVEMELAGIKLDLERWEQVGEQLEQQKATAAAQLNIHLRKASVQLNLFGDTTDVLNLDSHHQVLKALRDKRIPIQNTSKNQLIPLAQEYPVVGQLLAYRKATKALQAFIYSVPENVHPVTGRLHPKYHQMGASTGRFSCGQPNLQQIPRGKEFRSCFVASHGHKLVIADYSQIELRVVAEMSKDETMIHAYTTGQDLHRLTASLVANKPLNDVTKRERQAAKAVNFGLVYAMGARGLQEYAHTTYGVAMTIEEAELFRKRFFEAYAGVARWHKTVRASDSRVSRTLGGRIHRWRKDASVTGLYNWPVQGTAADIVKQALADLVGNFRKTSARIIGMVHDEIIIETPNREADDTAIILQDTMEAAGARYLSRVPVVAETIIAENWAEK